MTKTRSSLFVPIHVDGLYLKSNRRGVGAHADFTRLPFVAQGADQERWDANSSTPWLTEAICDPPFSDSDAELEAGVHLHWALPDSLTRGRHPLDPDGKPDRTRVVFPPVPNRWHVVRRAQGVIQAGWIIESDYLWPADYPWGRLDRAGFEAALGDEGPAIWQTLLGAGWLLASPTDPDAAIAAVADRQSNDLGAFRTRRADILNAFEELGAAPNSLRRKLTSIPFSNEVPEGFTRPGNPPFRYIGRQRRIGEAWPQEGPAHYMTPKTTGKLTALGYGDPTFAAFYPNCRSVFGFHEAIDGGLRDYTYEVFGWYSDPADDPLADAPKDAAAFGPWLEKTLQWSDPRRAGNTPGAIVCFGRVDAAVFVPAAGADLHGRTAPTAPDHDDRALSVSIANTASEALSACLADQIAGARHGHRVTERFAEKRKIEDYLQALHLAPDLEHRLLDVGAKFKEKRRTDGFVSLPGGRIWSIRADTEADAPADAHDRAAQVPADLPVELAAALRALNQSQRDYEHARRSIEAMREQVYFDWQRYMRFAYPHDDEALDLKASRDHHDLDIAIAFIRQGSIRVLEDLIADTGEVEVQTAEGHGHPVVRLLPGSQPASRAASVVAQVEAMRESIRQFHEHTATGADQKVKGWRLQSAPAPRFYQPKDPVVLLSHGPIEASDRHGTDHGPDGRELLGCFSLDCPVPSSVDDAARDAGAQVLVTQARELLDGLGRDPETRIGVRKAARRVGHPFSLDWEVAILPVRPGSNAPNPDSRYDPKFIRRNWRLGDEECTLSENKSLATMPEHASMLRGRGYVSPHADDLLNRRLQEYVARRMEEYYDAHTVPDAERGTGYLLAHYPQVRNWFGECGADQRARRDGRNLLKLQAAAPNGATFGFVEGGAIAEALLLMANHVTPRDLSENVGLGPELARSLFLRRAGAEYLASSVLKPEGDVRDGLFAALELPADLRPVLAGHFVEFLKILTAEPTVENEVSVTPVENLASVAGLSAEQMSMLPEARKAFATLVIYSVSTLPDEDLLAKDGPSPPAPLANPFATLAKLANLAVMQEEDGLAGASAFVRMLRSAQSNEFFGDLPDDLAYVQEVAPVLGLPTGGPLEKKVIKYTNAHLGDDDTTLIDTASLPDFVVEELRIHGPFASLTHLHATRMVDARVIAALLHATDKDHRYLSVSVDAAAFDAQMVGQVGGAPFASPAAAGHAWADPILTALEAWHTLRSGFVSLSQTLSGFHDALLMRRRRWQLPVADPIGFLEYRAFSERTVRRAVGPPRHDAILAGGFHPIRSGDLQILQLRLVDSFGQITDIRARHVTASNGWQSPRNMQVALPPRLTQPARLNFRWLDAEGGEEEFNQHPETSPVCGWVVLNNLEGRLMIHDTDGAPLGSLDPLGRWRPPPGRDGGVSDPDSIGNTALRRLVKWMQRESLREDGANDRMRGESLREDGAKDPFVASFIQLCETGLENIDPETFEHRQAQSLLMGRPMALVRAAVSIECRDPFALNQSLESFGKELAGRERSTGGFEHVRFPVRIGEHMQLNDGVVGVWPERGADFAVTAYQLPGATELDTTGITSDQIVDLRPLAGKRFPDATRLARALPADMDAQVRDKIVALSGRQTCLAPQSDWVRSSDLLTRREGREDLNLWVPITSPPAPSIVSVLMDPRGSLHATIGVLPTKTLDIPPADYVRAMNAINISLMAAPVLSAHGKVELLLPREDGWSWFWISKHDGRWSKLPATPEITLEEFTRAFGSDLGPDIWQKLQMAGWLKPSDHSGLRAVVVPGPGVIPAKTPAKTPAKLLRNGRSKTDLGDYADRAEAILRVIELGSRAISAPSLKAAFAEQELIEGWMLLSPADREVFSAEMHPEDDLDPDPPNPDFQIQREGE